MWIGGLVLAAAARRVPRCQECLTRNLRFPQSTGEREMLERMNLLDWIVVISVWLLPAALWLFKVWIDRGRG